MRVVVDARTATDHFPGIGRYVANLARALAGLDLDLTLLYDPAAPATRRALPSVRQVPCPVSPFALAQQWRVPGVLRRLGAGVYHSPYYLMPYTAPIPAVVTVYDLIPLMYPEYYTFAQRIIFYLSHALALRRTSAVLAISEATRRDLSRIFHVNPSRVAVTPLAADPIFRPPAAEAVARVRDRHGLASPYVLYVGSNKPHKNLVRLVQAWQKIANHPSLAAGTVLAIGGHWDARYPEARQAAEAGGVSASMRFLGSVGEADLPALYGGAEWFVFPSLCEGFGLPVLEAMACGTPVICSNLSSLPEVAGDAALQCDPTDTADLAAVLGRALSDPALRQEYARRGLARAGQFSWANTATATHAVYQTVAR